MILEEMIASQEAFDVDHKWALNTAIMAKELDNIHLIDLTRICIGELGYRIQGQGVNDKTVSIEGHISGMRRVINLLGQSFKDA